MAIQSLNFSTQLQANIRANLSRLSVQAAEPGELRRAAVALTVVPLEDSESFFGVRIEPNWKNHAAIIVTQRAAHLKKHARQWALPGGRIEPGESPEETALREMSEEVGLTRSPDDIIGRLDDYTTRSGFVITPIVVWGKSGIEFEPNPDEVDGVYRLPVSEILRDDAPYTQELEGCEHPALLMPIGISWIAAPTGAILYQFREVAILGKQTRVAHFEQPRFAWK
ncbi:MAG: CoA pyrophosphatase [Chloroflexota bacterium]